MVEHPLFFKSGENDLFGIIHEPETESLNKGFIFCHPYAEEKLWSHRVYVNFARLLVGLGFTVMRFDYMGHGDSDGDFSQSDIHTRIRDIETAINYLSSEYSVERGVSLFGLRLGATLASLVAEKVNSIRELIMWEPIIDGARYMKEMMRINMVTQTAVYKEIKLNSEALVEKMKSGESISIDGYEVGYKFYSQANDIKLIEKKKTFENPALIVQVNRREGQGTKRYQKFSDGYSNATLSSAVEEPFWKEIRDYYPSAENLYSTTHKWITANEQQ